MNVDSMETNNAVLTAVALLRSDELSWFESLETGGTVAFCERNRSRENLPSDFPRFRLRLPRPKTVSTDELCEELLGHMLDCEGCLRGEEAHCATHQILHQQITARGGAKTGVVFAF